VCCLYEMQSVGLSVYPNPHPTQLPSLLNLETCILASRQIQPHTTSQIIYPAHSTQASAIVCQCLLVLHVLLHVLPAHILFHSIQSSTKVCVLLHVSFLCVYRCRYLFLRTTSTRYKYTSTTPRIVHSFTRHSLDFNTYISTVMHYTTRYLLTGTAFTTNLHMPHQHVSPPCLDTSTESTSIHWHTQPRQRTRALPRLCNVSLRNPLT